MAVAHAGRALDCGSGGSGIVTRQSPVYSDSLDKVLGTYLAAVTTHPFTYNLGKKMVEVKPMPLHVSPLLLRGFTCPPLCGGCCPRFTLDYLPTEEHPYELQPRRIWMSSPQDSREFYSGPVVMDQIVDVSYSVLIFSDLQLVEVERPQPSDREMFREGRALLLINKTPNSDTYHFCNNLDFETGRCGIHGKQPFSCDFELIRFKRYQDHWSVNEQLFGRGWSFKTVIEDVRGAACTITEADEETAKDVARRITRLGQWADHFGLKDHRVPQILEFLEEEMADPQKAQRRILA